MPKRNTKFSEGWLDETDANDHKLKLWCCKGENDFSAYCFVCHKSIQCSNSGLLQVLQHAESQTHIKKASVVCSENQSKIKLVSTQKSSAAHQSSDESSVAPPASISLTNRKDDSTKAEIIWAAKTATSNYSFRSSDGIGNTFRAMFSNADTLRSFSMGRTKLSYLMAYGLGPAFKEQLIYDVRRSNSPFSLQYDETTQSQVKKQMELHFRYWSGEHDEVWVRYYFSEFFGHADGKTVSNAIMSSLKNDNVPLSQLLALGSDGPNVNKTIKRLLEEEVKTACPEFSGFVDIGTCNIHIIHNSFGKGLTEYGKDCEQLAVDLHSIFKYSAARREDFRELQLNLDLEQKVFLEHTSLRWLSIGPSVRRILEQWKAIIEFVHYLESDRKRTPDSAAFRRVQAAIKKPDILVQLNFLASAVPLFEDFLLNFQHDEPQIHILYEQMINLVRTFLLRFVKGDVVKSVSAPGLKKLDVSRKNQLSDGELTLGEPTRAELKKLSANQQKAALLGLRSFFSAVSNFLLTRLPLSNKLLRYLSCLNPDRRTQAPLTAIEYIAKQIHIPDDEVSYVSDEWRAYVHDDEVKTAAEESRVDHYWRRVFQLTTAVGNIKYPHLAKVVKAALVLPHGNADVERGVSVNNQIVTPERSRLKEDTINGLRSTKDMVKFSDPQQMRPEKIPINRTILSSARSAYSVYQRTVEEEKEQEERQRKLKEEEKEAAARRKQEMDELRVKKNSLQSSEALLNEQEAKFGEKLAGANELLKDGNTKLKDSLTKNDKRGIDAAQLMIETATKQMERYQNKLSAVREQQRVVESGKRKLLDKSLKISDKDLLEKPSAKKAKK